METKQKFKSFVETTERYVNPDQIIQKVKYLSSLKDKELSKIYLESGYEDYTPTSSKFKYFYMKQDALVAVYEAEFDEEEKGNLYIEWDLKTNKIEGLL